MPIDPNDFRTGGALQSAVAASVLRQRDAAAELAPGTQLGIYRVLRELGRGGMAIVYLAERADGEYEQQVALKWMRVAQVDAAAEAQFRRERQALADLRHPHIARLLDGGRSSDGRPWFAMEYIDGEPLDRHCIANKVPLGQRLHRFLEVCAAVAFAHAHGLIHRDIKPSNVLVDADGSAKLLDFGIAQLLDQDDDVAMLAFTPGFASPEQLRGQPLTVASDVYQLGRLLASILSADPRERETVVQGEAQRLTGVHVDASTTTESQVAFPAGLAPDLHAILSCAGASDPGQRYASVEALAQDVRAHLECRPVTARSGGIGYRSGRFVRRNAVATALVAMAATLLLVAAGVFTWRLAQERDRARLEAERAEAGEAFLVSLFRVSDPGVNRGEKLTARQLLERGAQRIEADTRATPAVRARLLQVLAEVNFSLGEYAPTQHLIERALREPTDAQQRISLQALQLWLQQRRGDAAATVAQAPAIIDAVPRGAEYDTLRARVLNAAARAATQTDDPRGVAWQAQALAAAQRAGDAEQQGVAWRTLGFTQEGKGDLRAALESTTRAVQFLSEAMGAGSPEVFSARANRAYLLCELHAVAQALQEIEALHREAVTMIPPEHIASLYIDSTRAWVLSDGGRSEEALAAGLDVIQRCVSVLGEKHMQCGHPMLAVANALRDLDRPAEALPWLERLVRNRRESMGAEHIYTAFAEHWLARVYCQTGRVADGMQLVARVSKRFDEELPADNFDRIEARKTVDLCEAPAAAASPTISATPG